MTEREKLYYLAGCIDCDGSVNVMRSHRTRANGTKFTSFVVRVTFVQVNPAIVELFRKTFGGNVYYYSSPYRERTRGWHQWYVAGKSACEVLSQLLPFLILKKSQAETALQLGNMLAGKVGNKFHPVSDEEQKIRLSLADKVRSFNARRTHKMFRGKQGAGTL